MKLSIPPRSDLSRFIKMLDRQVVGKEKYKTSWYPIEYELSADGDYGLLSYRIDIDESHLMIRFDDRGSLLGFVNWQE